jgi:hypothetical protein
MGTQLRRLASVDATRPHRAASSKEERKMSVHFRQTVAAAALALTLAPAALASGDLRSPDTPVTAGSPLERSALHESGRNVAVRFFRAIQHGHFARACALLGERLRAETGGADCPRVIAVGAPQPLRWTILRSSATRRSVEVLVRLDQPELGRLRLRVWAASIGFEAGELKILRTTLRQSAAGRDYRSGPDA